MKTTKALSLSHSYQQILHVPSQINQREKVNRRQPIQVF